MILKKNLFNSFANCCLIDLITIAWLILYYYFYIYSNYLDNIKLYFAMIEKV